MDRKRLKPDAVYFFAIDLKGDDSTDFSNLRDWYVELKDLEDIVNKNAYPEGKGKTPNLLVLLRTLSSNMFRTQVPVARYCFYVETM